MGTYTKTGTCWVIRTIEEEYLSFKNESIGVSDLVTAAIGHGDFLGRYEGDGKKVHVHITVEAEVIDDEGA